MRLTLLVALFFLCLFVPAVVQADSVAEADFWQLIADLDEEIRFGRPTDQLLDQLAAVDSVTLDNGQHVQLDTSTLLDQIENAEDQGEQEDILAALLDAKDVASAQPQLDASVDLETVLARPEFQYNVQESLRERIWRQLQEWFFGFFNQLQIGNAAAGYVISAVAAIVLLLFLFYWLRGMRRQFSAETELPFTSEADYHLSASDALQRAQKQAASGDYREAVRYLYLSALFSLDERDQLRFDRSKTNREYLRQVAGSDFAPTLNGVVDVFDRVWYGFQPIDGETYRHYEAQVEELAQS